MSRSKNNKRTMKRYRGHDLWGPRPMSKRAHTPDNKRLCRRIERREKPKEE